MAYTDVARDVTEREGHLAVVETHEEWKHLSKLTNEVYRRDFWVGARFTGTTWATENTCPAQYSWTTGTPEIPHHGECTGATVPVVAEDDPHNAGTWLEGVAPVACSLADKFHALCEI